MAYSYGCMRRMYVIAVGRFKEVCLKMLDEVVATRTPVVITKRAKRVAEFLPYVGSDSVRRLVGSILRETGRSNCDGSRTR